MYVLYLGRQPRPLGVVDGYRSQRESEDNPDVVNAPFVKLYTLVQYLPAASRLPKATACA